METDSVSIFAEGTFEEQIQELVNYILRNLPDEERAAAIRPFQDALAATDEKKTFAMVLEKIKGLGDGQEKEIEGFFNLIYAHLFTLFPPNTPEAKQHIDALQAVISAQPTEQTLIKFRILSNLFNAIPRSSSLRLSVYNTILQIAVANDSIDILHLNPSDVNKWLNEWDISPEQKSAFLKSIVDAYTKSDQPLKAYEYSIIYVRSLSPSSEQGKSAAAQIITSALRLPSVFDFDPLFKLDPVLSLKNDDLFGLLKIFLNDGLAEFNSWVSSHSGVLEKHNLDRTNLERKIRLLTLASLAFKNVGTKLPYAKVAEAIEVDVSQVEKWVIDGQFFIFLLSRLKLTVRPVIRAGLVSGKLSQTTHSLHVTRATARTFEREQWQALESRLLAWKSGLSGVLEVVANAKRQVGQTVSA
ncbi:hypothetical protein D9757_001224 [Collybiopsis confluens]|uniref:Eukaryotic translation initiation factor 3 subunit M n=1 Tax=Collybiopsis confluens TaxID=2823264 RepID=A0A8H5MGQ9_9AGAR|nr:hypothetical protein D9757_001224 [Collybiopsis confluens]